MVTQGHPLTDSFKHPHRPASVDDIGPRLGHRSTHNLGHQSSSNVPSSVVTRVVTPVPTAFRQPFRRPRPRTAVSATRRPPSLPRCIHPRHTPPQSPAVPGTAVAPRRHPAHQQQMPRSRGLGKGEPLPRGPLTQTASPGTRRWIASQRTHRSHGQRRGPSPAAVACCA